MIRTAQLSNSANLSHITSRLSQRMLNPICGITQEIGLVKRNKFGAAVFTAGAEIAGVHNLLNHPDPGRGAYHTGGTGIFLNEPVIKSLGETIERYSQLIAEHTNKHEFVFASFNEMHEKYHHVLDKDYLDLYTKEQLTRPHFPFQAFDGSKPINWVKIKSIHSNAFNYVPAQCLLVGYHIKKHLNEPWYGTAVTTGTAAHTDLIAALHGAILEIIQIDAAMGHWYGNYEIPEIVFDMRTKPMQNLLIKYGSLSYNTPRFFWLKSPDLAGFSIACLLERPEQSIPRVSVGLGSSVSLNDALYKAYLEAIGVANLGNILLLKDALYEENKKTNKTSEIYDIDRNVALYGKGYYHDVIQKKFNKKIIVSASDMPLDLEGDKVTQLHNLVRSFTDSGKELSLVDLTNKEAHELGFFVPRVWSKETLSLCFPSAPPVKHPRFKCYGGFSNEIPHPYP